MPTRRAVGLFILALILYFLANQTQIGWIYIITDSLIGLLMVAAIYSRGLLNNIYIARRLHNASIKATNPPAAVDKDGVLAEPDLTLATFHEDDPVEVTLHFHYTGLRPALLMGGLEQCPFAPADDQAQPFFIPGLFNGQIMSLTYRTWCDRRGIHRFSTIQLHSKGPFGLFRTGRTLAVPGEILIYPAYHPLKRLRVFEKKEFAEQPALRMGRGSQVIGTREYRPGDSPRQIHWRSTARTGQLVVKEFSDDQQQAFTVVLDLQADIAIGQGKFSTFETAIRLAASIGYYASQRNIPFRLVGSSLKWSPPAMQLSWWGLLNYLAKVENDGQEPLAKVLSRIPTATFVVILISRPHETIIKALSALSQPSREILAVFITPDGNIPAMAASLKVPGLAVKSVSPPHWVDFLADL